MRDSLQEKMEELAKLSVVKGIHVQKGQRVYIQAPIECVDFVHLLEKYAFENGAGNVYVRWEDRTLADYRCSYCTKEELEQLPAWETEGMNETGRDNGCIITVRSPRFTKNPKISSELEALMQRAEREATRVASACRMEGVCTWTVVLLPNEDWAHKVYPDMSPAEAMEKLTDALLDCSRVEVGRTLDNWTEHRKRLEKYADYLTKHCFKALHYKNGRGTDLTVALARGHVWCGGGVYHKSGLPFIPNIPTEEIATAPDRAGTSGVVYSTMPFLFDGNIIEGMKLTFCEGRVVDYYAEKGMEHLKRLLTCDAGGQSQYLGEVALVPCQSPIAETHTLFYNTILDENASCHLALGNGYPFCLKEGANLTGEQIREAGVNTGSLVHVDFMIGSEDMQVTGECADGTLVPIFKDGNWAFSVE